MSTAASKAGESTKPEPYLSDERLNALIENHQGTSFAIGASRVRSIYEPELQRLRSEVERLREVAQVACDALTATRMAAICTHDELECIAEKSPLDKALEQGLSALSKLSENGIKPSV
jgi:hypothetical protein